MLRPKCWSHACSGCKASEGAKALAGIVGTSACWVICGAFLHAILDQQLGVSDVLRLLEAKQQNCELHARAGAPVYYGLLIRQFKLLQLVHFPKVSEVRSAMLG